MQELFKDLQNVELRIARRKSLQSKLHASDLSDTENKAFVTSLLDNPEVKVIGASRGAIGHVITRLFTEQQVILYFEADVSTMRFSFGGFKMATHCKYTAFKKLKFEREKNRSQRDEAGRFKWIDCLYVVTLNWIKREGYFPPKFNWSQHFNVQSKERSFRYPSS